MPNETIPQNQATAAPTISPSQATAPLDPGVVNVAKAIRSVESGGDFQAKGASGEFGAYQFMPETWNGLSQKYLGQSVDLTQATPQQQNAVAYGYIRDLKNQGYNVGQIASIWNSGNPDPTGNVGTNDKGVSYDTPAYVQKVYSAYQQLKNQGSVASPYQPAQQPQSPSIGGFLGNVVSSGGNFIGNTLNALIHPVQTVQNLGSMAAGGFQELGGQQNENTQNFDALKQYFVNRYGSGQNILHTIYTDPVGVAADLSTIFAGGAGALGVAAKGAELGGLADTADTIANAGRLASRASDLTNPISAVGAGVGAVSSRTGNLAAQAANFATGGGADAATALYRAAQQGGDAEAAGRLGLSGAVDSQDILKMASDAADSVVNEGEASAAAKLSAATKSGASMNVSPIFQAFQDNLQKFGLADEQGNPVLSEDGKLDFSNTPFRFDKPEQDRIQTIYNEMQKFGLKAGQRTPEALQSLKRAFGSLYSQNSDVRAFVASMKSSVRGVLGQVPGYDEAMQGFQDIYKFQDDLQGALSIGGNAKADTIIRKLIGTLRSNDPFRVAVLQKLDEASGGTLVPTLAGHSYSPYFSRNLVGKAGEIGSIAHGLSGLLNPANLAMFAATSPRLVGELIMALGATHAQAAKFVDVVSAFKKMTNALQEVQKITSSQSTETAPPQSQQ